MANIDNAINIELMLIQEDINEKYLYGYLTDKNGNYKLNKYGDPIPVFKDGIDPTEVAKEKRDRMLAVFRKYGKSEKFIKEMEIAANKAIREGQRDRERR